MEFLMNLEHELHGCEAQMERSDINIGSFHSPTLRVRGDSCLFVVKEY